MVAGATSAARAAARRRLPRHADRLASAHLHAPNNIHRLQALQELDLSSTPLARVPPALAAAPALRRLALRGSLAAPLGAPDVRAVLARLPALAELSVDVAALPPPQQLDVRAELPHVRIALQ